MTFLKRKVKCGVCNLTVIADVEKEKIFCGCCKEGYELPRFITISAYNLRLWKKSGEYSDISKGEFDALLEIAQRY